MASITAERNPFFQHAHGFDGGPAEQTISFSARVFSALQHHFGGAHHRPGGEFIGLSARHSAEDGGIGHRFDKHKDRPAPNRLPHHRMDHRLGNLLRGQSNGK